MLLRYKQRNSISQPTLSKESQEAYRSQGCTEAEEINEELGEKEPSDVQMEYPLILLSAGKRQPMGALNQNRR